MNMQSKHYEWIRTGQLMKFYKCKEWQALRQLAIERAFHECEHCKNKGKVTTRNTLTRHGKKMKMDVNHKKPVKEFPHLALTLDNLEYLCVICHNIADEKDEKIRGGKPKFVNEERW